MGNVRSYISHLGLSLLLLLLHINPINGQKVGVVLSGGGAKGLAHIGVLKCLEEHQIPIDYITGTSIGAIIGALYAAGYSPYEIEEMAVSGQFENWATNNVDAQYFYYFKKDDPDAGWGSYSFNFDSIWQSSLPSGIIPTFLLDFSAQKLLAGATAVSKGNFDSLFVPFRCVAADIEANQAMVIKEGNLGKAIRASMTYPFYFKPIRIEGKLLYDGGMYNNFPADVMYDDFFPDIIIGSKTAGNFGKPSDYDIISHLQTMLMETTEYSVICDNSILIEPDIPPTGLIDFSRSQIIIDSGYIATARKIYEIRLFVTDSVSESEMIHKRMQFRERFPEEIIDRITVSGVTIQQYKYVSNAMSQSLKLGRAKKEQLTFIEVENEYMKLAADNLFQSMDPVIRFDSVNNTYLLDLKLSRKKMFLAKFGGVFSSKPINTTFIQLGYQHLGRNKHVITAGTYFGRFYNSFKIADRIEFVSAFPFYFKTSFSINNRNYFYSNSAFLEDNTPSYIIEDDKHWRFSLGKGIDNYGKFDAGLVTGRLMDKYYHTTNFRNKDTLDRTTFDYYSPFFSVDINTLNRKQYASKGNRIQFIINYVNGSEQHRPGSTSIFEEISSANHSWLSVDFRYYQYYQLKEKHTLGIAFQSFFSNQKPFNNYTASILFAPCWQPIPDAATRYLPNIRSFAFSSIGIRYIYLLMDQVELHTELHSYHPYKEIHKNETQNAVLVKNFGKIYTASAASLVYHSPIGPVAFSVIYYQNAKSPLSISVDIGYTLFNEKAYFH
ncbi:MAG: patatin-like phospholipase family protein [Bacteroidales bacterium]|nr:patatin-like phospholipase family protein [Bacteroidales bacterium]